MSWQLARFIDRSLTCYGKVLWCKGLPALLETKFDQTVDGHRTNGPTQGAGFETNVLSPDDRIPMVAYLSQIELLNAQAELVAVVQFEAWATMSENEIEELKRGDDGN